MNKLIPEKIFRLNRLTDIFILAMAAFALIIIQLPFPFEFNKGAILLTTIVTITLLLIWHLLTPGRVPGKISSLVDSLVGVAAISIVVYFTGGIKSYFVFLYFLPALTLASNTSLIFASLFLGTTYGFLFVQALIQVPQLGLITSFSLAAFHFWTIGVVVAYGRFLAREAGFAHQREEQVRIERTEEVGKLKDEFVFIVSHELRSPITAIRGYLELIMTDNKAPLSSQLKEIFSKAFTTANKLANLISLLLEISRLESGKIKFYLQKVKLVDNLEMVVDPIKNELEYKHISLELDVGRSLEVMIDAERLAEILTILLENALRFTPEYGKIKLSATDSSGVVLLKVEDSGIGIVSELKEHLFDKFYNFGVGEGRQVKGVGLGLYACKRLLKAMGGDISVESEIGVGTKFTLSLPKPS